MGFPSRSLFLVIFARVGRPWLFPKIRKKNEQFKGTGGLRTKHKSRKQNFFFVVKCSRTFFFEKENKAATGAHFWVELVLFRQHTLFWEWHSQCGNILPDIYR